MTREHNKHAKLDQQYSTNKTRKTVEIELSNKKIVIRNT